MSGRILQQNSLATKSGRVHFVNICCLEYFNIKYMRATNSLNVVVRHVCAVLTIYFLNNIIF